MEKSKNCIIKSFRNNFITYIGRPILITHIMLCTISRNQKMHVAIITICLSLILQNVSSSAIRSYDWVGFDNQCFRNCDYGPRCYISNHDDGDYSYMRGGLNSNEKFRIIARGKGKNEAIRHGDTIGLYWGGDNEWWFSCDCNGYCLGRTCPGMYCLLG